MFGFIYEALSVVPGTEEALKYLVGKWRVNKVTPKVLSRSLPKEDDSKNVSRWSSVHEITKWAKACGVGATGMQLGWQVCMRKPCVWGWERSRDQIRQGLASYGKGFELDAQEPWEAIKDFNKRKDTVFLNICSLLLLH